MSGQNKRINNTIMEVNQIIEELGLEYIHPIRFVGDTRDFDLEYQKIINQISEVIGELRGLTLKIAGRTEEKINKYKDTIIDLQDLRNEMQEMRKKNI